MELVKILLKDADRIAPLVAAFRAQLKSYKGIIAQPDIEAGNEEIIEKICRRLTAGRDFAAYNNMWPVKPMPEQRSSGG